MDSQPNVVTTYSGARVRGFSASVRLLFLRLASYPAVSPLP